MNVSTVGIVEMRIIMFIKIIDTNDDKKDS